MIGRIVIIRVANPCHRYRWRINVRCPHVYSGAHLCYRPGGHAGACRCANCGKLGRGKDHAA